MNKKYYTAFIPFNLADLLDSAGMEYVEFNSTTYAEAFDFFIGKGLGAGIISFTNPSKYTFYIDGYIKDDIFIPAFDSSKEGRAIYATWHEAANDAIESVLNILEQQKKALEMLQKQVKNKDNEKEKQD
jgi:hypothetical protein